jgi:hypothetical protein
MNNSSGPPKPYHSLLVDAGVADIVPEGALSLTGTPFANNGSAPSPLEVCLFQKP